jgi:GNAT superfamily N-acetyltransferase
MIADRSSLFCDTGLAARIERAEAELITALGAATGRRIGSAAGFAMPIAGGVACFAEDGSPYNKVVALGFDGVPNAAALDDIEEAYAARGAHTQIELAHLADSAIGLLLTERGYRLESFENVLGRVIAPGPEPVMPPGVEVRPSPGAELETWLDVVVDGAAHPDTEGLPWHEEFPREMLENAERDSAAAGVMRYAALRDGVLAGGASLRVSDGVAQFAGAATAPAHRRRGIQSALLSARLADAAAAGCEVAVITTQPGSRSHENAQRQGFDLLYTRAVLVKRA